jgi:uncharacterized protein involved in exopolysaccharide biosynthesis
MMQGTESSDRQRGRAVEAEQVGVLQLVNVLLKRWKLVFGLPMAAAIITAGISLLLTEKFTAIVTFVPEAEESGMSLPGGLAGVAAQFGVSIPSGGANSPSFYADVLKSRTLRDQLLLADFADPRAPGSTDNVMLLDLLEVEGENEANRLEVGRAELKEITSVSIDNETNIVSVGVETPYPSLSADVANHYIELLNLFNLEARRSNAQERRDFVEERVAAAERELWEAEEEQKEFLQRNRQYAGSPELQFQYDRLNRQVVIKQEVVSSLRRQYEDARIQEVNDTPVITVIDRAVPPVEKSSPQRRAAVVLAFLLCGVLSITGAFGAEYVERARQREDEDLDELASHWAAIKREVGSKLRLRRDG